MPRSKGTTTTSAKLNGISSSTVVAAVINLFIEKDVGAAMSQSETALSRLDREVDRYETLLSEKDREIAAFRRENADELAGNETQRRRLDQKEGELSGIDFSIEQAQRRRQTLMGELASTPRRDMTGRWITLRPSRRRSSALGLSCRVSVGYLSATPVSRMRASQSLGWK